MLGSRVLGVGLLKEVSTGGDASVSSSPERCSRASRLSSSPERCLRAPVGCLRDPEAVFERQAAIFEPWGAVFEGPTQLVSRAVDLFTRSQAVCPCVTGLGPVPGGVTGGDFFPAEANEDVADRSVGHESLDDIRSRGSAIEADVADVEHFEEEAALVEVDWSGLSRTTLAPSSARLASSAAEASVAAFLAAPTFS